MPRHGDTLYVSHSRHLLWSLSRVAGEEEPSRKEIPIGTPAGCTCPSFPPGILVLTTTHDRTVRRESQKFRQMFEHPTAPASYAVRYV